MTFVYETVKGFLRIYFRIRNLRGVFMEISQRIKEIRIKRNLKQKDFASRLLVTPSYISRVESGTEIPSKIFVKLVALEFNVNYEWLCSGEGKMDEIDNYSVIDEKLQHSRDCLFNKKISNLINASNNAPKESFIDVSDMLTAICNILNHKSETEAYKRILIEKCRNIIYYMSIAVESSYDEDTIAKFEKCFKFMDSEFFNVSEKEENTKSLNEISKNKND